MLGVTARRCIDRIDGVDMRTDVPAVVQILPILGVPNLLYIPNYTMQKIQKIKESSHDSRFTHAHVPVPRRPPRTSPFLV